MKLLLLGATGLVGSHVLEQALRDHRIAEVTAPTRRAIPGRDRLNAVQVDYENLPQRADWWKADAVICALGTTRRLAGSAEAFRRFDHDLVLEALRLAHEHGTPTLAIVSAAGANPSSRFLYPRVKGDTERGAVALGFNSVTILRPGLIAGDRVGRRPVERAALALARAFQPILPRDWRVNPAERIAKVLVEAITLPTPGHHLVTARDLA